MKRNNVLSADNQQERPKGLNPWYIVGFVEGEGTFHVAIYKDPRMKFGIKIIPEFHISQNKLRLITLMRIKKYFDCGYIKENHRTKASDRSYVYVVRNRQDLITKIIPFFEKYPMLSEKQKTYVLFMNIVHMLNKSNHGTKNGMKKLIKYSFRMNEDGKYRSISLKDMLNLLESSETTR